MQGLAMSTWHVLGTSQRVPGAPLVALIYPSARVWEQMSQILARLIGVRAIFGVPRASIWDFCLVLFLCFFTRLLLLDVLLGGLISAHCLTVFWTSFVLGRSQGIAFDALVGRFDEPMLRLLCADNSRRFLQATLTGLSAVSSTECGVARVHEAEATIACA